MYAEDHKAEIIQSALCKCMCMWTCHGVLTTGGGAVLVLCSSRLLFLLSSSLTGSLTRTPWYGLGLVSADCGAREAEIKRERCEFPLRCTEVVSVMEIKSSQCQWLELCKVTEGHVFWHWTLTSKRQKTEWSKKKRGQLTDKNLHISTLDEVVRSYFTLYHMHHICLLIKIGSVTKQHWPLILYNMIGTDI